MRRRKEHLWTIIFFAFALVCLDCGGAIAKEKARIAPEEKELIQVKIHRVTIDPNSMQPVVLLLDLKEERGLPVWIGANEAKAIDGEMQGIKNPRPFTHDLLENVLRKVNLSVRKVIITHSQGGTYFAKLIVEKDGGMLEIDARPSDSMVLALKFKAPIFISRKLFHEASVSLSERKGPEEVYGLTVQELTPQLAQSFSYRSKSGALISDVRGDSRAEKDGLKRGDIITEAGGKSVEDVASFKETFAKGQSPLKVKIFREAQFLFITLHPR